MTARRTPRFEQPMVAADFGYSLSGAVLAVAAASVLAAALYAFIHWPVETAGALLAAVLLGALGRHPLASSLR